MRWHKICLGLYPSELNRLRIRKILEVENVLR